MTRLPCRAFRPVAAVLGGIFLPLLSPQPAHAIQAHAYEGLYLHQIAHVFFLVAMVLFALRIQRSLLARRRPWHWIAAGAWLLALWNLWAFAGHFLEMQLPATSLLVESGEEVPRLALRSWHEVAYFLAKMDHLLAVPAIFCFYFGLRGISRNLEQGAGEGGGGSA